MHLQSDLTIKDEYVSEIERKDKYIKKNYYED